jgi:glycosyltransferase involved in cell wall biosynthesis
MKIFIVSGSNNFLNRLFYPFIIISHIYKFNKTLKFYNPDVIQFNPSLEWVSIIRDYFFIRVAKKSNFPIILFVRGWRKNISKYFNDENIISKFFKHLFEIPNVILVLSTEAKNELINLGINPKKIIIKNTMVVSKNYKPMNKKFNQPYTILFCSRIEKGKGIYELVDAINLILKEFPQTITYIVGNGSELKNLIKFIKNKKLNDKIICTNYKTGTNKIKYFLDADIFVLPSYTEGFPNVFPEALSAGLPFVATGVGGLKEALVDNINGVSINSLPPNPKEIAEKIITLMKNPSLMKKISSNNIKEAKNKYDIKKNIEQMEKLYYEIVRN